MCLCLFSYLAIVVVVGTVGAAERTNVEATSGSGVGVVSLVVNSVGERNGVGLGSGNCSFLKIDISVIFKPLDIISFEDQILYCL